MKKRMYLEKERWLPLPQVWHWHLLWEQRAALREAKLRAALPGRLLPLQKKAGRMFRKTVRDLKPRKAGRQNFQSTRR